MKIFRMALKPLKKYIDLLKSPNLWLYNLSNQRTRMHLVMLTTLFMMLGIVLNTKWPFPHFECFAFCFLLIGILGLCSIVYFSQKMKCITSSLLHQKAACKANAQYSSNYSNSFIYILGPSAIIMIFGSGALSMFGALKLTPTLIWIILLFSIVVYISIIGYIQYIVLALYIRNLAHSASYYKQTSKSLVEYIPAQTEWLQILTKLSHTYRSAFFTLGSTYIGAYGLFCYSPEMQANISSLAFYLLWSIIFVVIVLLFPIISILEYQWIKIIVEHLKLSYIRDLDRENWIAKQNNSINMSPVTDQLARLLYATQILNSKDYPLKSMWETGYATILSVFNFIATIATITQGFPNLANAFLQIF